MDPTDFRDILSMFNDEHVEYLDGTKVRANPSKRKAKSYDRMKAEEKRLREEIRELVNRAKQTDAEEDQRGDELPDEPATREKRLATIQAAMKRLEERPIGESDPKAQDNFTDCRPARPRVLASLRRIPRVICDRVPVYTGSRTTINR